MLKSFILALLMGDHGLLEIEAQALARLSGAEASRELVDEQLRAFRLLEEVDRLSRLGAKLGGKLVGGSDEFEEGLAGLLDEDAFAEWLGELARVAMAALVEPGLAARIDAEFAARPMLAEVSLRFMAEVEPLNRFSGRPLPSFLAEDTSQLRALPAKDLGRSVIELLYDPAASPKTAAFAWAAVRTVGRMMVVRHFEAHQLSSRSGSRPETEPTPEYSASLFDDCASDVGQLEEVIASLYEGGPGGRIQLQLDGYEVRRNRIAIDEAMDQLDADSGAWADRLGSTPDLD